MHKDMRRIRMTVVHEFSWVGGSLKSEDIDRLAANFMKDPAAFLNLESPEWDEVLIVDFEDVTNDRS